MQRHVLGIEGPQLRRASLSVDFEDPATECPCARCRRGAGDAGAAASADSSGDGANQAKHNDLIDSRAFNNRGGVWRAYVCFRVGRQTRARRGA